MQTLVQPRRTRDDVLGVLRRLITEGKIADGSKLEEIALSKRMGVSRTPVREALITLQSEGWVEATPNKGVHLVAADQKMVAEVYPILAALESEALLSSGQALRNSAGKLRGVNRKLAAETRHSRQHALDAAFHRMLVEQCGNARLLRLLETHWALARRFDGAGKRGTANHQGTCEQHEAIIDAIAAGEMERAASLLRQHWHQGIGVVTKWLESEPESRS